VRRSGWPAPSARLIADDTPPPMAPDENICISITKGKHQRHGGQRRLAQQPT
jgi:hypothetical protein